MPYKNKRLGGKDEEETKREWISVPNPMPDKTNYDEQFLLSGATGGRVPPAMMERMQEPFKMKKRLGGEK